jgi:hypothetical protein
MIILIGLIIILLTYILINYINKEKFMVLYNDINEYLNNNLDDKILRDSYCFDNDKLLAEIKGDSNLTCSNYYENVSDIFYKVPENPEKLKTPQTEQEKKNSFYDSRNNKSYSFAELCPITTKQLNSLLCLRKHNNDISDSLFRLDNILIDTDISINNNLNEIEEKIINYRNDKYRLFNTSNIQNYFNNN